MKKDVDWDEVVEDLGPRFYRYFCARFPEAEADDLTQETLVRLVRKVREGSFDPSRGNLRMLGFGIAHYVALEAKPMKSEVALEEREHVDESQNLENNLIENEKRQSVRAGFSSLSQMEQQVLSLVIEEELKLADISMLLQLPVGTIKSHVHRAKMKLISLLGGGVYE